MSVITVSMNRIQGQRLPKEELEGKCPSAERNYRECLFYLFCKMRTVYVQGLLSDDCGIHIHIVELLLLSS